jgi:arsenate reductase (thioredoxin)
MSRIRILFLCTGNSCRSQMAEGWARHLKSDVLEAHSAGISAHGLNPRAVKVMAEVGVDISKQRSKNIAEIKQLGFDWVVTVCDNAREACPIFPGRVRTLHRSFDDPPRLAEALPDEEQKLAVYRRVRDEIRDFVLSLPESLTKGKEHE